MMTKLAAVLSVLASTFLSAESAFDALDPNGNITIKWDIRAWIDDGYVATVSIFNWQQYRHIEAPGWKLAWACAQTSQQGDCSRFRADPLPHCCDPCPVVFDLLPSAPPSLRHPNCCKGGLLASLGQNPEAALAAFQITVGLAGTTNTTVKLPRSLFPPPTAPENINIRVRV